MQLLRREVELVDQVDPEAGPPAEQLTDRVVHLALRRLDLGVRGRRAGEPHVLAEVDGHLPAAAAERPGADPNDLTARGELVEPGRAVGAEAAGKHVPLPDLGRERDSL